MNQKREEFQILKYSVRIKFQWVAQGGRDIRHAGTEDLIYATSVVNNNIPTLDYLDCPFKVRGLREQFEAKALG